MMNTTQVVYDVLYSLYSQYIKDPSYVYSSCNTKWVVIMKSETDLTVVSIFNKLYPNKTCDKIYDSEMQLFYTVGKNVSSYRNKEVKTFNSIIDAYSYDFNMKSINDTILCSYHQDKKINKIYNFFNNKICSRQLYYNLDGKICGQDTYLNDELIEEIRYYPNGIIRTKISNQVEYKYFKNGQISEIINYGKDYNTYHGTYMCFYKNEEFKFDESSEPDTINFGNLKIKANYYKDKLHGEYCEYSENGKIKTKSEYIKDKLQGFSYEFYDSGLIKSKSYYVNDKRHGIYLEYHPNGKLKIKTYYTNDKKNGLYLEYFDIGELVIKTNYVNDEIHGEYSKYLDFKCYQKNYINSIEQKVNVLRV